MLCPQPISTVHAHTAELDPTTYSLEFPDDGARLVFKGKTKTYESAGHTEQARDYALDLELYGKVAADKAQTSLTGKSLYISVPKQGQYFCTGILQPCIAGLTLFRTSFTELKLEYWPRLTKEKVKLNYVKTGKQHWIYTREVLLFLDLMPFYL